MKELLELRTRREIYSLISKNPGVHLSKIADFLKMRISLVEYHIYFLEKNQIITSVKDSGYTRYYVKGKIGTANKKILSILRQETPLRIVLFLLKKKNAKHKEILDQFKIAPSTLSYHLKKLVVFEIVNVKSFGDDKGYTINNSEQILQIILQYKPYSLIEGFKDVWFDLKVD
jgi:predicted transcriptional regulator